MTKTTKLSAPFPYFGGKSAIVDELNARFGDVTLRIDAFCGSAAWILRTPYTPTVTEIINDASADIVNVYRAIRADPEKVAFYTDTPKSTIELNARIRWLAHTRNERTHCATNDADWYDAKAAGWWVWCVSGAVGGLTNLHLHRQKTAISVTNEGIFTQSRRDRVAVLTAIAERLRHTIILCSDWRLAVNRRKTIVKMKKTRHVTAILLDPPYPKPTRARKMQYLVDDSDTIWYDAAQWAVEHGDDPALRIAVCGYGTPDADALFPKSWSRFRWTRGGGIANRSSTSLKQFRFQETVWFSPHCIVPSTLL